MTCKTVEIRDRGTFVPALLVRLDPVDERDRWLLARAGYGDTPDKQRNYVLLIKLHDAPYDPFKHDTRARTYQVAHQHAIKHFAGIQNGAVLDVEHLLGETAKPKLSEQVAHDHD